MNRDRHQVIYLCVKAYDALAEAREILAHDDNPTPSGLTLIDQYIDEIQQLAIEISEQIND